MSNIAINSISNLATKVGSSFISIIMMPIYLQKLGAESFGMVGVYNSVLVIMSFLDFGYSGVVLQEAAKAKIPIDKNEALSLGNLVRSIEVTALLTSLLIFLLTTLTVTLIDQALLKNILSLKSDLKTVVVLLVLSAIIRIPLASYNGLMNGLSRQFSANVIVFCCNVIRAVLTLIIISFIEPTLIGFFVAQIISNFLELCFIMVFGWKSLPNVFFKSSFDVRLVKKFKGFAFGILTLSISAAMVSQLERIVLVTRISMEEFGYFTLASSVVGGILSLVYPFTSNLAPIFTRLRFQDSGNIRNMYSQSTAVAMLLVIPLAIFFYLNSNELLTIYLRNSLYARTIDPILRIMLLGIVPIPIAQIAHILLVSYGKSKVISISNLVFFFSYGIILILVAPTCGVAKILEYWAGLNLLYVSVLTIAAYATVHQRLLGLFGWSFITLFLPTLWMTVCGVIVHSAFKLIFIPKLIKYIFEYSCTLILCFASVWKFFSGIGKNHSNHINQ